MAKQDKATREKILSGLKSEVLKAKKAPVKKVAEQIKPIENIEVEKPIENIEVEKPIENIEVEKPIENIEVEKPIENIETPIIETIENVQKPLTLFSNFTKKTEEDLNKTYVQEVAENLLTQNVTSDDLNPDEDSPEYKRIMAEAEATGGVEVAELIMCVLCMWLSGDWSKNAFDTYKISKEKKKVIIISLVKIAVTKKKKSNPTWGLALMILSASVPMLVIALMTRIGKNRDKKKEEEHKAALAKIERLEAQKIAYMQNLNPVNTPFSDLEKNQLSYGHYEAMDGNGKKVETIVKKDNRGRHKRTCASQLKKGGVCDCKN